jgi:hypothetical protein
MGWIRDRMEYLEPPVQSFMELAQRLRKARSWPRGERIKETSLATYLGKFDAGEALEWLEQRPGALQALGEILDMSQEEVDERLMQLQPPKVAGGSRVRLRDVPTRPMDLRRDSLPPGIPSEVRDTGSWPLWWQAPIGSGRTLAGQWLEARGHAMFLQAQTWAEAEHQLPEQGAVYVELGSAEGVPTQASWPPGLKICVATETPPPRPQEPEPERGLRSLHDFAEGHAPRRPPASPWLVVRSPEVRSWLRDLVRWVEERVTADGFNGAECLRWLETPEILARIDTPGTAMGLIGLFATFGRKGDSSALTKARGPGDLARLFLRMRLQQSEGVDLPLDVLWKRLQHVGQCLLLESESPWFEARSLDAWHALVHMRPDDADLEWLKELERQGLKLDRADLEKIQGRLPPDAFRVVRTMRELGLLGERGPQHWAFQPPWVLAGLIEQAILETLEQGAHAWGAILLRQEHATTVFEALLERCRSGDFSLVRSVLREPDLRSPAWVAALEASFRVLGLVVLEGKSVPDELRLSVLRLQRALVVPDASGLPRPRIAYELASTKDSFLLVDHRIWYAALLALSEALPPQADLAIESWFTKPSSDALRWLLYMASYRSTHEQRMPEEWLLPLLLLGGRLMDRLGPLTPPSVAAPLLLQAERLLRFIQQQNLSLSQLNQAVSWHAVGALLPEYARRRGVDWQQCARDVWASWLSSSALELPPFLQPDEAHAAIFWKFLPPRAVEVLADRRHRHLLGEKDACRFFRQEHWDAFVQVWLAQTEPWGVSPLQALWQRIPPEHVRQALRAGKPDHHDHLTRKELWQRMPEVFCEEIDALFRQGQWDRGLTQVWGAPPSYIPRLLASAKAALEHRRAPPPSSVVQWLHQMIAQRAPDWSKAWTLLEYLIPPAPV